MRKAKVLGLHSLWSEGVQSHFSSLQVILISKEIVHGFNSGDMNQTARLFLSLQGALTEGEVLSVMQWNMMHREAGGWNMMNKGASAAEGLHMGWCIVWFVGGCLYVLMCCIWLTLWCILGLHKLQLFFDETAPKKVVSAHGSRDPDKSWCEAKPPKHT